MKKESKIIIGILIILAILPLTAPHSINPFKKNPVLDDYGVVKDNGVKIFGEGWDFTLIPQFQLGNGNRLDWNEIPSNIIKEIIITKLRNNYYKFDANFCNLTSNQKNSVEYLIFNRKSFNNLTGKDIEITSDSIKINKTALIEISFLDLVGQNYVIESINKTDVVVGNLSENFIDSGDGTYCIYFDPTVTIDEDEVVADSYLSEVIAEGNFTHLNISGSALYDSLIAYYPFDGDLNNSGFTAYDWSKYGNDATANGNAQLTSECIYGECLICDADGDYIETPLPTGITERNPYTVSLWVKCPSYQGLTGFINIQNGTAGPGQVILGYFDDSSNGIRLSSHQTSSFGVVASSTVDYLNWVHIVINSSGNNRPSLWVNGVDNTSVSGSTLSRFGDTVFQVGKGYSSTYDSNCSFDEVMLFNISLTEQQIIDIYNNQSARFKTIGTQRVRAINITNSGTWNNGGYDRVNLTASFENLLSSNISARVGQINLSVNVSGLVLYTPFEFDSAFDISNTGNDGTLNGNSYWNSSGGLNNTGAYSFDGGNSYIDLGNDDSLLLSNFTVSMWINGGSTQVSYATLFSKGKSGFERRHTYGCYFSSTSDTIIKCFIGNESNHESTGTVTTTVNKWNHIVFTGNSTNIHVYLNGQSGSKVSRTLVGIAGDGDIAIIGSLSDAGVYDFNGSIDNVMIFNRSLSAIEILSLYQNQTTQKEEIYYTQYQNLTNSGSYQVFNISKEADFILPDFKFYAGNSTTPFYSPIIYGNITLDTWTAPAEAPADNPPVSTLSHPEDGNLTGLGNVTFQCNSTDDNNLTNVTFYLWNPDDSLNTTNPVDISGTSNSTYFYFNFTGTGLYNWNCLVGDNNSQYDFDTNRTINITTTIKKYTEVSACGTLNADTSYVLTQDLNPTSGSYCFLLDGDNITFNGNGFSFLNETFREEIFYSATYRKNITIANMTLMSLKGSRWQATQIFGVGEGSTIENMNFSRGYASIRVKEGNMMIRNCTFEDTGTYGIYQSEIAESIHFVNNSIIGYNNDFWLGVEGKGISNSIFENIKIEGGGVDTPATDFFTIYDSKNLTFRNIEIDGITHKGSANFIKFDTVNDSEIYNNTLINGQIYYMVELVERSDNNQIYNNTFHFNVSKTGGAHGIIVREGRNNSVFNNTVIGGSFAYLFHNGSKNNVYWNNYAEDSVRGVYFIDDSRDNELHNSTFNNCTTGVYFYSYPANENYQPRRNIVSGINITNGNNQGIKFENMSSNNRIIDTIITQGTANIDAIYHSSNNTLINVTFTSDSVDSTSNLTVKWYYQAYVNDSNGNAISGAIITAYNKTNGVEFNITTNSSGWTNITEIIDYVNIGGTKNYLSNYTINATNITLTTTQQYNVTSYKNKLDNVFTLNITTPAVSDTTYPSFYNISTSPSNNTQYTLNANYQFNLTINNTNGTAGIEFNGVNYTLSNSSGIFYASVSDLGVGDYSYYIWAFGNGSDNNYNISDTYGYKVAQNTTLALSITGTTPITYGTAGDFEGVNCPTQLTCNLFRNNTSVSNPDTTTLGAGTYNYTYNTTGNTNYSSTTVSSTLTVNQATPTLTYLANGGTSNLSLIYPQQVNISATSDAGTVNLDRDGIDRLSENSDNVTLGVGDYTYRANVTGNQNYSSIDYRYYNVTINESTDGCTALFNETSPVTYPGKFLVWGNCGNFTLQRNGTIITNNSEQDLAAGNYNFSVYRNDTQNYTNIQNSSIFTINKGTAEVYLYVNQSRANETIQNDTSIWLNATTNTGDSSATLELFNNETKINTGTSTLSNFTAYNLSGIYNITAVYLESQNYTVDSETWYLNVTNITEVAVTPTVSARNITHGGGSKRFAQYVGIENVSVTLCELTYMSLLEFGVDYSNIETLKNEYYRRKSKNVSSMDVRKYLDNWQPLCSDIINRTLRPEEVCQEVFRTIVKADFKPNIHNVTELKNSLRGEKNIDISLDLLTLYFNDYYKLCVKNGYSEPLRKNLSIIAENLKKSDTVLIIIMAFLFSIILLYLLANFLFKNLRNKLYDIERNIIHREINRV